MNWLPSLPLFTKELTESAARKRTYVLRVIFALLLYIAFALAARSEGIGNPRLGMMAHLGKGEDLFKFLLWSLLFGIGLFTPAMCAGLITSEKERDSLTLLLLTKLGPWKILLQKYLGGLLPIFSLLALGLPLTAIAYSYGGIPFSHLCAGSACLFLMAAQLAAMALLCSSYFRTTVSAFLATYLLAAFVYGGFVFFAPFIADQIFYTTPFRTGRAFDWLKWVFPPLAVDNADTPEKLAFRIIPALFSILVFLALARFYLVRRAFLSGTNPLRRFFIGLDGLMTRLKVLTGTITLSTNDHGLPTSAPIASRELKQKALARPNYLFRLLVVIEVPVIFLGLVGLGIGAHSELSVVTAGVGILAVLLVSVNASNAFVAERIQQTLDVLLTTPLSAREIVLQKAQVIRRLIYVVATPISTLDLFEFLVSGSRNSPYVIDTAPVLFLLNSALSLLIYLPLVCWLSLWFGLRTRTRFRAIITALSVIVFWCVVPLFAAVWIYEFLTPYSAYDSFFVLPFFLSPLSVPAFFHIRPSIHFPPPALTLLINYAFYGTILWLIRRRCLSRADFYLRR